MNALPHSPAANASEEDWFTVTYRVGCSAESIEERARVLAVEQSVEMPVEAIRDPGIRERFLGRVGAIEPDGPDHHRVKVQLAVETTGFEASQLINMAFGNSSLHPDVELVGLTLPRRLLAAFPGPRFGIPGIRDLVGAEGRALTCTALKPQGLPASELARLAQTFARAGVDVIKDDHGLANQSFSPFAERVAAVQSAIARANRETGHRTVYAPSMSGGPKALAEQVRIVREEGVGMVLLAPMLAGIPALVELVRDSLQVPLLAHPAFAGAQRVAPPLLIGKLFRIFGADAVIFPSHGGRFSYSPQKCRAIADCARGEIGSLKAALPVPAGGMKLERIPEMLEFYGSDTMLLIGGALLAADEGVPAAAKAFVEAVRT